MVNIRDYRHFRFWSRDHGCGPMSSYLHLPITNKYCAIRWLMYGKRSPRYTAKIFSSNSPKRYVRGPLNETAVPNSRNHKGNGQKFSGQRFVGLFGGGGGEGKRYL